MAFMKVRRQYASLASYNINNVHNDSRKQADYSSFVGMFFFYVQYFQTPQLYIAHHFYFWVSSTENGLGNSS